MAAARVPPTLPDQFGRYRIVRRLGQGAMGAVYLAHDTQLDRAVALKVPHITAEDGPGALQRFHREARAAAALDHVNLCRVYDVGTQNDVPYLTMAYVEGRTLAEVIKEGRLMPQSEAAGIVRKLALAMYEAHAKGIIHRDLKPANVMINRRGEPVVMDFGLARLSSRTNTRLTQLGSVMGTPSYMPPEQVRGDVDALGPRCDIYSLGALLYHVLTGHVPFEGPVDVVLGQILTQPPPPPSSYRSDLDPRLEAVCLRAMQKDIAARYASMSEMAAALADCVRASASPIAAGVSIQQTQPALPRSVLERAVPAARTVCEGHGAARRDETSAVRGQPGRARLGMGIAVVLVGGIAFLFLTVSVGGVVALLVWATTGPTLHTAVVPSPRPHEELENPIVPLKTEEKLDKTVAPAKTEEKPEKPAGPPKTEEKPDKPPKAEEKTDMPVAPPKVEEKKLDKPIAPAVPAAPLPFAGEIRRFTDAGGGVAFTPDGRHALLPDKRVSMRVSMRLWDLETGGEIRRFGGGNALDTVSGGVAIAPDGRRALSGMIQGVAIWDVETGKPLRNIKADGGPPYAQIVALAPDGRRALSAIRDPSAPIGKQASCALWDVESGTLLRRFERRFCHVTSVAFAPDGRRALSGACHDKIVYLWDVDSGKELFRLEGHSDEVTSVAFAPDRRRALAVSGSNDTTARVWDVETRKELCCFKGHTGPVLCVAFSQDGSFVLTGSADKTVRMWDVKTSKELYRFTEHTDKVVGVAFSPNGRFALTGSLDNTVRLLRLPEQTAPAPVKASNP